MNKHVFIFSILCACFSVNSLYGADFTGNATCRSCHENEYQQWVGSDHEKSMAPALNSSVLGDFSDVTVNFHNIDTRFYINDGNYYVDTLGDQGQPQSFQVKYTFGFDPLQQYLVEMSNGHVQVLNIAWDSRPEDQGGQRWIHLQPDENITPEHPFYWTNHFQNWNSRCAECHSTNVDRNYDADTLSYTTQWSEINVSCEGCHGPASDHVQMAGSANFSGGLFGFEADIGNNSAFVFEEGSAIATNTGTDSQAQLDTCAACHSRRGVVGDYLANKEYHDQFQLSLLNQGLYFADGQISDEVFVFGSFLQSKMYEAGVTCMNCHNPHTSELRVQGNPLCLACHQAQSYQVISHHQHAPDSSGAQCVSCHMPEHTYMQVDDRADHSFSIPRPQLANKIGAPDACSSCHQDWSEGEVVSNYEAVFGKESLSPWAEANYEIGRLNILALPDILAVANDNTESSIKRASLLSQAGNYPARITLESIQQNLGDPDSLVRRAAVEATGFLTQQGRLQLLEPLFDDEVKTVRLAVANRLADAFNLAPDRLKPRLLQLFDEYEDSLLFNEDTPGAQLNLGSFFYRRGNFLAAERAYLRALQIEPAFVPALLNLADFRREQGNEKAAESLLQQALVVTPDSAATYYALGLLYVRENNLQQALGSLRTATELDDTSPRYAYVYAVALESSDRKMAAIEILKESDLRWPNQPESLLLLVSYLDEEQRGTELLPYLSSLSRIMPADPNVAAWVNKYARAQ